jgi:hypothetical protein
MKKKLLLAGLGIVIGLGWLYHVGREEHIKKLCEEINYRVDCADAWSKYRLTGDPGDHPLCDTGEMSIRQRINSVHGVSAPPWVRTAGRQLSRLRSKSCFVCKKPYDSG